MHRHLRGQLHVGVRHRRDVDYAQLGGQDLAAIRALPRHRRQQSEQRGGAAEDRLDVLVSLLIPCVEFNGIDTRNLVSRSIEPLSPVLNSI